MSVLPKSSREPKQLSRQVLWKEEREEEGNKITSNAPFVPGAELGTSINIKREL